MAETIAVACPACKARIKAPPELAGKAARCPKCKGKVRVPRLPTQEPVLELDDEPVRQNNPVSAAPRLPVALAIVGVLLTGVALVVVSRSLRRDGRDEVTEAPRSAPAAPRTESQEKLMLDQVKLYFEAQVRGERYPDIKNFNTCRKYTVLNSHCTPNNPETLNLAPEQGGSIKTNGQGSVGVRVEYSDRNGIPVVRDWKLFLYSKGEPASWYIYDFE